MKSEPLRQVAAAACAVAACTILVLAAGPARAADPDPSPTPPSPSSTTTYDKVPDEFALTVSPTRIVVSQDRVGETQELLVVNQGEAPLTVTVQKRDFTGAPDGTMVFAEDAPYSASSWVTLEPSTFTVPPGGTQTVTAVVRVAPHAEPGDHQVAFVFLVPALKTSNNITINRGVGVPMYVTVPGPTDNSVTLTGLSASGFSAGGLVDVSAVLTSTGTVHRDFRDGTPLELEAGGRSVPFPDFTVVRDGVRDVSTTWDPPLMCVCHLSVSFVNDDGQTQHATVRIIVFPVRLAAGTLLAVVAAGLLIVWRRRRFDGHVQAAAALLNRPVGAQNL